MADNRSASRQRKTNQNRAARQSLATRRAAAAEKATAQAKAEEEADKAVAKALKTQPKGGSKAVAKGGSSRTTASKSTSSKSTATKSKPAAARSSLKARAAVRDDVIDDDDIEIIEDDDVEERPVRGARGARAPRGPSPVPDYGPGLAGWWAGVREVPGGVAVAASVFLGLLAFVFFTFVFKFPQGPFNTIANGAKGLDPPEKQTGAELGGAVGIVISLLPVFVSVVALLFTLRPQRRKVWLICVFVTLAMVTLGAGTAGLPCVIALGWGYWKTSKAEREY